MWPPRQLSDETLLRLRDVIAPRGPVPVSRSTLYLWVSQGRFPAPVKVSSRVVAWRWRDVRAFLENLNSARPAN